MKLQKDQNGQHITKDLFASIMPYLKEIETSGPLLVFLTNGFEN